MPRMETSDRRNARRGGSHDSTRRPGLRPCARHQRRGRRSHSSGDQQYARKYADSRGSTADGRHVANSRGARGHLDCRVGEGRALVRYSMRSTFSWDFEEVPAASPERCRLRRHHRNGAKRVRIRRGAVPKDGNHGKGYGGAYASVEQAHRTDFNSLATAESSP